jgi:hypothetical protein
MNLNIKVEVIIKETQEKKEIRQIMSGNEELGRGILYILPSLRMNELPFTVTGRMKETTIHVYQ